MLDTKLAVPLQCHSEAPGCDHTSCGELCFRH